MFIVPSRVSRLLLMVVWIKVEPIDSGNGTSRRRGFVEGSMSVGMGFEVSKALHHSELTLPPSQGWRYEFSPVLAATSLLLRTLTLWSQKPKYALSFKSTLIDHTYLDVTLIDRCAYHNHIPGWYFRQGKERGNKKHIVYTIIYL